MDEYLDKMKSLKVQGYAQLTIVTYRNTQSSIHGFMCRAINQRYLRGENYELRQAIPRDYTRTHLGRQWL
jgi:hypothetical protein